MAAWDDELQYEPLLQYVYTASTNVLSCCVAFAQYDDDLTPRAQEYANSLAYEAVVHWENVESGRSAWVS